MREKRKAYLTEIFGSKCTVCDKVGIMIIHRKDGQKHKVFGVMNMTEIKKEVENHREEYVRVCGICHAGIHWAMEYLGLTWNDIISGLKIADL